jgi:hypothetical protein
VNSKEEVGKIIQGNLIPADIKMDNVSLELATPARCIQYMDAMIKSHGIERGQTATRTVRKNGVHVGGISRTELVVSVRVGKTTTWIVAAVVKRQDQLYDFRVACLSTQETMSKAGLLAHLLNNHLIGTYQGNYYYLLDWDWGIVGVVEEYLI